jgi:hypothetical protein
MFFCEFCQPKELQIALKYEPSVEGGYEKHLVFFRQQIVEGAW